MSRASPIETNMGSIHSIKTATPLLVGMQNTCNTFPTPLRPSLERKKAYKESHADIGESPKDIKFPYARNITGPISLTEGPRFLCPIRYPSSFSRDSCVVGTNSSIMYYRVSRKVWHLGSHSILKQAARSRRRQQTLFWCLTQRSPL